MTTAQDVADAISARKTGIAGRMFVAIVGAPGAGKSTLTDALPDLLENAIVVGMDGFHLDNSVLEDRGLAARKGSPESFDVNGLAHLLSRLRAGGEAVAPTFDRELDVSRAGAIVVTNAHDIVIVEGNYLLLEEAPWAQLREFWDMTVMLDVPLEVLRARLLKRWLDLGLTQAIAEEKVAQNDLPNAQRVITGSVRADVICRGINE